MEQEILKKLDEQDKKLQTILESSEKMRKYFMWTFWISIIVIVLPLVGMVFVLPSFFNGLTIPEGL